jgi:hypothetical protein
MTDDVIRTLRLPRELFERVEEARGVTTDRPRGWMPREVWIRDAIELALQDLPPVGDLATLRERLGNGSS